MEAADSRMGYRQTQIALHPLALESSAFEGMASALVPSYVLSECKERCRDRIAFPLLDDGSEVRVVSGVRYRLRVRWLDGSTDPLFSGGLLTVAEIERIADAVAGHIADCYSHRRVVLLGVLEGGKAFYDRVAARLRSRGFPVESASTKLRRYSSGSRASDSLETALVRDANGRPISSLHGYECVVVLDDLLDTGGTLARLIEDALRPLRSREIDAYFMVEKAVDRRAELAEVLRHVRLIGRRIPDEWAVGYGPNLTLSGAETAGPLHLFRGDLPGGMYAFNREIEPRLSSEYRQDPSSIAQQLRVYVSER